MQVQPEYSKQPQGRLIFWIMLSLLFAEFILSGNAVSIYPYCKIQVKVVRFDFVSSASLFLFWAMRYPE